MDQEDGKLEDDRPPTLGHNIWFWFWQILHWVYWGLVSVIYIPWALAMHLLLAVAAVPLAPLCCMRNGRKVFIYTYVCAVMLPGKFIWFNAFLRTRRRGQVWDFEMGQPRAINTERRRRLSQDCRRIETGNSQEHSLLFTKLPPEIRLQIYNEVFFGGSSYLHITQSKVRESRRRPPQIKIHGYPCSKDLGGSRTSKCRCISGNHPHQTSPNLDDGGLVDERDTKAASGRIALLQTCRQIYSEAIDLLYRAPTFCFSNLENPPFFLRSALPQRLAQIRTLRLVYKQLPPASSRTVGTNVARFNHKIQNCAFCNTSQWLKLIHQTMLGLKKVDVFLYLDKKWPIPKLTQGWVPHLLALQNGPHGMVHMSVKIFCNIDEDPSNLSDYRRDMRSFKKAIQRELKRGVSNKSQVEVGPEEATSTEDPLCLRPSDALSVVEPVMMNYDPPEPHQDLPG